jgi:hypothetical protein
MNTTRPNLVLRTLLLGLACASLASAQATRTWVSGVGDDANPCSRTAPCKTFAGAISKTAASGEINVLDPGGFGAVTITKSITISSEGFEAGVLVSGTNGVVINAAATDKVVLRGLDFEGLGTGLSGVNILSAGTVIIENCTINNFVTNGISAQPSANPLKLTVKDTVLRNNNLGTQTAGIFIKAPAGSTVAATITGVRSDRNDLGIVVQNAATVAIMDSSFSNNDLQGVNSSIPNAGNSPSIILSSSVVAGNPTGFRIDGSGAVTRISDVTVQGNTTAFLITNSAQVLSFGTNPIAGNNGGEPPTAGFSAIPLK